MVTKSQVEKALDKIPDPELGVSILALGLIYKIEVKGGNVHIVMTLTTIGCPLFDQIAEPVREGVSMIKGVKNVEIELTFDPPWTPDRMKEESKMQLGF